MPANNVETHELTLSDVTRELTANRWKIAVFCASSLFFAFGYIVTATPVYKADALFQLERRHVREGTVTRIATEFGTETTIPAEISVIKSRSVLGKVVDDLGLELKVEPNPIPIIGRLASKFLSPAQLSGNGWLKRYTLDGESVTVELFDVPPTYRDKPFTLVADADSVRLYDTNDRPVVSVTVGGLVEFEFDDMPFRIHISDIKAHAGATFSLTRKSRIGAITELQRNLLAGEEGNESRLIRISLLGEDRDAIKNIVDAVAESYLKFHHTWRSEEITRTLAVLEDQLPVLERESKNAESAVRDFRLGNASVDLPIETERLITRSVQIESDLDELRRERERYAPDHPSRLVLTQDIASLKRNLDAVNARMRRLPQLQQRSVELMRAADTKAALYSRVLNNIQELSVFKGVSPSEVRMIDGGDSSNLPAKPEKGLIVAFSLLIGLFLGTMSVIIRRVRQGSSYDPQLLERTLQLPVYVALPYSSQQRMLERTQKSGKPAVLAQSIPTDVAVEGLRSLRTWISTSAFKRTNNAILVSGPSMGVGKSFVSVNLAAVFAAAGRRVLLIDADLRKGTLDRHLMTDRSPGLSDFINGSVTDFSAVCHLIGSEEFHLLPKGSEVPGWPELLLNKRFSKMIALACEQYDEVIVDSPPILAVSDAAIIGQHMGSALLVVREGINTAEELEEATKRLLQTGVPLRGVVFNGVKSPRSRYAYQYGYY